MNENKMIKDINALIEKYDSMKKQDLKDLSSDQDLTLAIMNLIGIEEHLFFTGAKTDKPEYYELIKEVRSMRKELLRKIIVEYEGEVWCTSKHLLAASYRLMEVGTKQLDLGNEEESYDFFSKAYNLYTLFWAVVMKVLPPSKVKNIESQMMGKDKESANVVSKFKELAKKLINCCIE